MFRLLRAFAPGAADAVGGCLFYAVGLPLLLTFIGGFLLVAVSDFSAHPPGDPYFGTQMAWIIAAAAAIDVAVYLFRMHRKGRL